MVEISFPRPTPEFRGGGLRGREGIRKRCNYTFTKSFPLISADLILIFKKDLFLFRQRGREEEREEEKHQCVTASHEFPNGDPGGNPGTCPNRIEPATFWFTGWTEIH